MKALLTLALSVILSGCADPMSYYRPYVASTRPPKPKDFKPVVYGAMPAGKVYLMGRMTFHTTYGHKRMIRMVEDVTRRVGGDAAVMLENYSKLVNFAHYVPGYTSRQAVNTVTTFGGNNPLAYPWQKNGHLRNGVLNILRARCSPRTHGSSHPQRREHGRCGDFLLETYSPRQ